MHADSNNCFTCICHFESVLNLNRKYCDVRSVGGTEGGEINGGKTQGVRF